MTTIDLTPLYRSTIGFDRFGSLLNSALRNDQGSAGYPPYNIEVTDEDRYAVTLAVAGFDRDELDIQVENGVLTVRGSKDGESDNRQFLYQGIATRNFERKFSLADHVEVRGAIMKNGLLSINLVKEMPEEMKPRSIPIEHEQEAIEQEAEASDGAGTIKAA